MNTSKNGPGERLVTIGGTFDELHRGHKDYVRLAFEFSTRVIVYVNSKQFNATQFAKGRKKYLARPYDYRLEKLKEFLQELEGENPLQRIRYQIRELHQFDDLKKDYLDNPELKEVYMAIVSPEYYADFCELNRLREARGQSNFLILVKQRTRDLQQDISSTLVREVLHCPSDNITTRTNEPSQTDAVISV